MDIRILVATHKPSKMPDDSVYLPIHVGKERYPEMDLGFMGDNTGENISSYNAAFNELTAIFWAWKNLSADCIGLAHYRRHFCVRKAGEKWNCVLSGAEARALLQDVDIIVPNKRRYYIETIESHHRNLPYTVDSDLDCMRRVIHERHPQYATAFEMVMKRRWAHMFNMFIMTRELFDDYCQFLFDVVLEVNARIDMRGRKPIEARLYISEFLLDTWLETRRYSYKEVPVKHMEKQNMLKKCSLLILRKAGLSGEVKAA